MAIRKLEIPGKLITTPGLVFQGPTGQYGFSQESNNVPEAMFQSVANYDNSEGAADSFVGIFSVWYLSSGFGDQEFLLILNNFVGTGVRHRITTSNLQGFACSLTDGAGNTVLSVSNSSLSLEESVWHHFLLSWDVTSGNTFADNFHAYIDDVDVKPEAASTFDDGTLITWGATHSSGPGRLGFGNTTQVSPNWAIGSIWLTNQAYLDFSIEANRRKFIDASGLPVALGEQGQFPTGTQPPFYFDDPVATIANNRGNAGAFQLDDNPGIIDVAGPNP